MGFARRQIGGTENVTLQSNQMPIHSHLVNCNSAGGNQAPPGDGLLAVESTGTSVNYTTAAADSTMNSAMIGNAGSNALWSVNLDGSGLALVRNHLTNAPLGIGLDVFSQKIYGTDSSGIA